MIDGLWITEAPLPVRGVSGGADLLGAARVDDRDDGPRQLAPQGAYRTVEADPRLPLSPEGWGEAAADAIRHVLTETIDPEAVSMHFASNVTDDESRVLRPGLNRRGRRR